MVDKLKNFKIQTAYNKIIACYSNEHLELRSGKGALQSVIDLQNPHRLQLRNLEYLMAVLLFIPEPRRILMLGTAAGSLLHFLRFHYPKSSITAVDIDTEMIEELLKREILPAAQSGLSYVHSDAAQFIRNTDKSYDLVLLDIFNGSHSPAWLLEKESIDSLARLLNQQAALAYNLIIDSEHDFKRFYRDLRLVFDQQTLYLPVKGLENTIAFAIRSTSTTQDMSGHMQQAMLMSERLEIDLMRVLSVIYNTNPVNHGVI